jgi:oligosaccharide repeat unit polymerase
MKSMLSLPIKNFFLITVLVLVSGLFSFRSQSILDGIIVFLGLGIIYFYIIAKKQKDYFDPFYLFSLYYISVYVAALFLVEEGIKNNRYVYSTRFYNDIDQVYTLALLISLVSYISALIGYEIVAGKYPVNPMHKTRGIESPLFLFVSLFFYVVGSINFIYILMTLYAGNVLAYFRNISVRGIEFSDGITTIGYQLVYAASYMLFLRALQTERLKPLTYLLVSGSILIMASNGRVTQTIFYALSFIIIYYYNGGAFKIKRWIPLLFLFMPLIGVAFHSFRYMSSLYYNEYIDTMDIRLLIHFFDIESLASSISRGNIPNFPVLMKVIDSWGKDIGYMFGSTLLYPIYGFISNNLFELVEMPAVSAKEVWYSTLIGGNLPVTGMGEMVANFSIIGFPLGMFLFGALGGYFSNTLFRNRSQAFLILYSRFIPFFALYPKGEFNNFNLLWMAFPSLIFWLSIRFTRAVSLR